MVIIEIDKQFVNRGTILIDLLADENVRNFGRRSLVPSSAFATSQQSSANEKHVISFFTEQSNISSIHSWTFFWEMRR